MEISEYEDRYMLKEIEYKRKMRGKEASNIQ